MEMVAVKVQAHPKHPPLSPAFLLSLPELMGGSQRPLMCSTWLLFHRHLCSLPAIFSITLISHYMTVIAS